MRVRDIMSTDPVTISIDATLAEASALMNKYSIRRLPVVDREKTVAIITRSDLLRATPSSNQPPPHNNAEYVFARTKVRDILPEDLRLIKIHQDAFVEQAAKIIRDNKISGLPVVDDQDKLVGIVSVNDILDALLEILSVNRKGTRLDLKVKDGEIAPFKTITDIAFEYGVKIENIVGLEHEESQEIIVRLATLDYKPLVDRLQKAGWQVESITIKQ